MSPVFRTHSDHGVREPWKFSAQAKNLFRKQTRMRYALAPYFYTLSREAHTDGLPLIRPLYLEYNGEDGGARDRKNQYLVGRDLLVIPADRPGSPVSGRCSKWAYFPDGNWIGVENGETVRGLMNAEIEIPLELLPLYAREGAIIPCQEVGDTIGVKTPDTLRIEYYPRPDHLSVYELYEDDGESKQCEQGAFAVTTLEGRRENNQILFKISKPRGKYEGMPAQRTFFVHVRLAAAEKISTAETRTGNGAWTSIPCDEISACLGGTIPSQNRYAVLRVESDGSAVRIRAKIA